ncbi:MAG: hydrogenase maturation nickel metallochaperone HypA [Phycisphaerales bacterium JB039]
MHEGAIAEALVEQVGRWLPPGAALQRICIEVGALEHIEAEPLRWHWVALTEGTALAGAELVVERIPLEVRCAACGRTYEPEEPALLVCPGCGAARPEILRGTGIVLKRLEADEPEPPSPAHGAS